MPMSQMALYDPAGRNDPRGHLNGSYLNNVTYDRSDTAYYCCDATRSAVPLA